MKSGEKSSGGIEGKLEEGEGLIRPKHILGLSASPSKQNLCSAKPVSLGFLLSMLPPPVPLSPLLQEDWFGSLLSGSFLVKNKGSTLRS